MLVIGDLRKDQTLCILYVAMALIVLLLLGPRRGAAPQTASVPGQRARGRTGSGTVMARHGAVAHAAAGVSTHAAKGARRVVV